MDTVDTEFSSVEVWFTDEVSKALEIKDNVVLTLIIAFCHLLENLVINMVKK